MNDEFDPNRANEKGNASEEAIAGRADEEEFDDVDDSGDDDADDLDADDADAGMEE